MKKTKTKKTENEHYVNAKEFREQLIELYKSDDNPITDELATAIFKIAEGLSYKSNFINYSFREDMIGDAIVKMMTALEYRKFDISKTSSNPSLAFSYFTTIAWNSFVNRIKKEKRHREIIEKVQEQLYEEQLCSDEHNIYTRRTSDELEYE